MRAAPRRSWSRWRGTGVKLRTSCWLPVRCLGAQREPHHHGKEMPAAYKVGRGALCHEQRVCQGRVAAAGCAGRLFLGRDTDGLLYQAGAYE